MLIITAAGRLRLVAHERAQLWGLTLATIAADDRAGALLAAVDLATQIAQFEDAKDWRAIVLATERQMQTATIGEIT